MSGPVVHEAFAQLILDRVKVALREHISSEIVDRLGIEVTAEWMSNILAARLQTEILEHRLPPVVMRDHVTFETGHWRWRTPLDHARARYAGRWFARLMGTPRAEWIAESVQRGVELQVRQGWTFPRSTIAYPPSLGSVALSTCVERTVWS